MSEQVILVDSSDREKGVMDKERAHREGHLHRAISVFVINSAGEMLLQRRAESKYHSGGLWSNACCSHPRPGETTEAAAERRLQEEMGIHTPLRPAFRFVYFTPLDHSFFEYEYDHVFIGKTDAAPLPDSSEVMEWKWIHPVDLCADLDMNPGKYTLWFQLILKDVLKHCGC